MLELELDYREARSRTDLTWVDVREDIEVEQDPGPEDIQFVRIPMSQWRAAPAGPLIIVCSHGVRSLHLAKYLKDQGHPDVCSLRGGLSSLAP